MSARPDPEAAFRRFRETGDPASLADVFDTTAPELLRVAVHLCGDAATAEDLVQGTFLAAIEGAAGYDDARPLLPWLLGILTNRSRMERRRSGRPVDVERLLGREPEPPEEAVQRRELSGDLAREIDRLPPSLRAPMVLFHRHGMSPADIAHVLDLAPGNVRVLLHRGREALRRRLPAGLGLGALMPLPAPRGLSAVRDAVLARASGAAATATVAGSLAGAMLMKKALVAAAVLVALGAGTWAWNASRPDPAEVARPPATLEVGPSAPGDAPTLSGSAPASPPAAGAPAPPDGSRLMKGVVLDRATGTPVAGALLALHPPRKAVLSDLLRRHGALFEQSPWSDVRAVAPVPSFAGALTGPQRFADAPLDVFEMPPGAELPVSSTRSGADGSFEMPLSPAGGLLLCTREGYARRTVPVLAGRAEGPLTIRLGRSRHRGGTVVDPEGRPFLAPLSILFRAFAARNEPPEPCALVETKDGRFEVTLDVEQHAMVQSRTAGVRLAPQNSSPEMPAVVSFSAKDEETPLTLVATATPALFVVDARTRAPIEVFHLRGIDRGQEVVHWTGRFLASGGRLELFPDVTMMQNVRGLTVAFDAWAEGHRSAHVEVPDVTSRETIEVALEPGEAPVLSGVVRDRAGPVAGAAVALLGYRTIAWTGTETTFVDRAESGADGAFVLRGANGRYLLRVERGDVTAHRLVDLPASALVIDLDDRTGIDVRVEDTEGVPRPGHVVAIRGPDGRSERVTTDGAGRAAFERLTPGHYLLLAPFHTTTDSFVADVKEELELASGGRPTVTLRVPSGTGAVPVRVTMDGTWNPSEWRVRGSSSTQGTWAPLAADGAAAIVHGTQQVEIEGPAGFRYVVGVPKTLRPDFEIRLSDRGPAYEGLLIDGPTGHPIRGVRVTAGPPSPSEGAFPSCVSDENGRFRLPCSEDRPHALLFSERVDDAWWNTYRYSGTRFQLSRSPSNPGRGLKVVLPRIAQDGSVDLPTLRVSGRVLRGEHPVEGATLFLSSLFPAEDGVLDLGPGASRGMVKTGTDGRYEVRIPRAPRYRATGHDYGGNKPLFQEEWDASGEAGDVVRDFQVR